MPWTGILSDEYIKKKSISRPLPFNAHHGVHARPPRKAHESPFFAPMPRYTTARSDRAEYLYTLAALENPQAPDYGKQRSLYHTALEAYRARSLPPQMPEEDEVVFDPRHNREVSALTPPRYKSPLTSMEWALTAGRRIVDLRERAGLSPELFKELPLNVKYLVGGLPDVDPKAVLPAISEGSFKEDPSYDFVLRKLLSNADEAKRARIEDLVEEMSAPFAPEPTTSLEPLIASPLPASTEPLTASAFGALSHSPG